MIEASAPGKLYIAGEYAVLEPNHPAILIALNQYITVHLEESQTVGTISSSYSNFMPIPWTRKNGTVFVDERENPFNYVIQAIKTTEDYVRALNKPLRFYNLSIESDLDNKDGRKYGLGSSGAVTVATIKALLAFYEVDYTKDMVYKLSVLTHLAIHSNGSFGDIAASTYGGWIAYSTFNRQWLQQKSQTTPIEKLIAMDWADLMIKPLPAPTDLQLAIGWTGSPASTTSLVDQVQEDVEQEENYHERFLIEARAIVETMIEAFFNHDSKAICAGISQYRTLLQQLTQHTGVIIETPALTSLCNIALDNGGVAKSSGAGGGDCGIALLPKEADLTKLSEDWEKHQIEYLHFQVHTEGKHENE